MSSVSGKLTIELLHYHVRQQINQANTLKGSGLDTAPLDIYISKALNTIYENQMPFDLLDSLTRVYVNVPYEATNYGASIKYENLINYHSFISGSVNNIPISKIPANLKDLYQNNSLLKGDIDNCFVYAVAVKDEIQIYCGQYDYLNISLSVVVRVPDPKIGGYVNRLVNPPEEVERVDIDWPIKYNNLLIKSVVYEIINSVQNSNK